MEFKLIHIPKWRQKHAPSFLWSCLEHGKLSTKLATNNVTHSCTHLLLLSPRGRDYFLSPIYIYDCSNQSTDCYTSEAVSVFRLGQERPGSFNFYFLKALRYHVRKSKFYWRVEWGPVGKQAAWERLWAGASNWKPAPRFQVWDWHHPGFSNPRRVQQILREKTKTPKLSSSPTSDPQNCEKI